MCGLHPGGEGEVLNVNEEVDNQYCCSWDRNECAIEDIRVAYRRFLTFGAVGFEMGLHASERFRNPALRLQVVTVINVETDPSVSCGSYNSSVTAKVNFKEITTSCTFIPRLYQIQLVTQHDCYVNTHATTSHRHYLRFQGHRRRITTLTQCGQPSPVLAVHWPRL
jgi:hypothetical protein